MINGYLEMMFEHITNNCLELYDKWILGNDDYRVSPNLLSYIIQEIKSVSL